MANSIHIGWQAEKFMSGSVTYMQREDAREEETRSNSTDSKTDGVTQSALAGPHRLALSAVLLLPLPPRDS